MRLILLVVALILSGNAFALDAPEVALSMAGAGRISVQVKTSAPVTGFNVYLNKQYYRTVRPSRGATTFEFNGGDGAYCVVGFETTASGTQYSVCSNSVDYRESGTISTPGPTTGLPGAPRNLRTIRYSTTAGELFWEPATAEERITGYKVTRDGQVLFTRDARSYFDASLQRDRTYQYQVVTVDQKGRESTPAQVTLGISGSSTGATPPTTPITPPASPNSSFSVQLAQTQVELREGDPPVTVPIQLTRGSGNQQAVELSVQGDTAIAGQQIQVSFDRTTVSANQNSASLQIKLSVGMAPIQTQSRQLQVRASDSRTQVDSALTLNIIPVDAPDVYLLLGQSNMEGYSEIGAKQSGAGQPDEPMERIRQLNVQPNSRTVFRENWQFTDEQSNVLSPLFVRAEDPLHEPLWPGQSRKGATFVGPSLSFAKAALPYTTRQIILVPAAWGATGFCANNNGDLAWNASRTSDPALGGTLMIDRALTRLNMALRESGGIWRAMIWHQGGADSNNPECVSTYADNVKRLMARLRREARVDKRGASARGDSAAVPLLVATMSKGKDARADFSIVSPGRAGVDDVHRTIRSLVPFSDYINNDDLVPPAYPCGQSSCVHFGAAANRVQGYRMNEALQRIVNRR